MSWLGGIVAEFEATASLALLVLAPLVGALAPRAAAVDRRRVRGALLFTSLHYVAVLGAGLLAGTESRWHRDLRLAALALGAIALASLLSLLVFRVVLPRVRVHLPRIVEDVLTAVVTAALLLGVASRAGWNLTGLIATSAVLTAVIGLALQDTLGNIVGGLALQIDGSVRVGDWIEVAGKQGRVVEIRWRYTALETRDWETLIVPNSQLLKNPVLVLARRMGSPPYLRRWVSFHVETTQSPARVTRVVSEALRAAAIPGVMTDPPPDCVFSRYEEGMARYAVRYFLADLERDAPVDHEVMLRVWHALGRAGMAVATPTRRIDLEEQSDVVRDARRDREAEARAEALLRIDLAQALSAEERRRLARSLVPESFAPGEVLARQGEPGECLHLLTQGRVVVSVRDDQGHERDLAELGPGDFFGEMSLLTGEARTATLTAREEVHTFRVTREVFEELLRARPELANEVASVLAARKAELEAARRELDLEARQSLTDDERRHLLGRIRSFFGLTSTGSSGRDGDG